MYIYIYNILQKQENKLIKRLINLFSCVTLPLPPLCLYLHQFTCQFILYVILLNVMPLYS